MLSTNQKATRMFRLLRGMSAAPVFAILAKRGCSEQIIAHGWDLLKAANSARLLKPRGVASAPATEALAASQAAWFPVADATLEARYPTVHERIFRNLGRGSGPDLYVAMQTFHDRVAGLYVSTDVTDKEASDLLQARGLTSSVLTQMVEEIESFKKLSVSDDAADAEAIKKAEDDLSAFYVEWSKIVRSAVKDRRMLLAMGFLRRTGKKPETAPVGAPEPAGTKPVSVPAGSAPTSKVPS
jgi:hypothetical protein